MSYRSDIIVHGPIGGQMRDPLFECLVRAVRPVKRFHHHLEIVIAKFLRDRSVGVFHRAEHVWGIRRDESKGLGAIVDLCHRHFLFLLRSRAASSYQVAQKRKSPRLASRTLSCVKWFKRNHYVFATISCPRRHGSSQTVMFMGDTMPIKRTCSAQGCNKIADAASGTMCAVHATLPMFNLPEQSSKKTDSALTIALERNRGAASLKEPLSEPSNYLEKTVLETAARYGECWLDKSHGEVRRTLERMFAAGLIIPLPRVARQKRHLVRYEVTPKGKAQLSRKAAA